MSRFWSAVVGTLKPYVPGEQPKVQDLIKLNTNEHPSGPSPKVIEAICAAANDTLKRYPDPSSERLRGTIARYYGVDTDQVFVGNGSDEVLAHVFQALLKHPLPLRFPDISYSFYPVYCGLYGIAYEAVPLAEDFRIDPACFGAADASPAGAIIFPNPNAPTGLLLPLAAIEQVLQANPQAVVVVDEAYVDFGGETAIGLVARYDNLLVVQTLSKSRSLAGLRVGFAIGQQPLIDALERVKNSFNSYPVDRLAEAGAIAAFEDDAYFLRTRSEVMASRDRLVQALTARGFDVLPSAANFVFVRHGSRDAAGLSAALRERRIIVRHFNQPRISNFLRITIGTPAECDALIHALDTILA